MDQVGRGTVLAGRYRLDDEHTTSLPGVKVWSAFDTILDKPVVVRVLDEVPAAPVLDAARRAALVVDPRLVRVLDVGARDGLGYVVTEQVTGPSLAQLVRREPLSADQARAVVGEAAAALEAARRRGVHHLALRPSAVSVAPDGRVLVSGLALDAVLLGRTAGDARSTSRTDAVDLVRLVYAALTGHWPGPPETAGGLPAAPVVGGSVVPPGQLVEGVPPDLDTLCAVTFGPHEDGPHSPGEVVRELEPWGDIRVSTPTRRDVRASGSSAVLAAGAAAGTGAAGAGAAGAGAVAAGAAAAGAVAARLPASPPPAPAGPPRVARQSVRTAFDGPTAGTNRPGTPPPAVPGRTGAFPAVPGAGGPQAYPPHAYPPQAYPPQSAGPVGPASRAIPPAAAAPQSWAQGGAAAVGGGSTPTDDPFEFGRPPDEPGGRRLSTGGIVMIVVAVAVLLVLGLAVRALLTGNGAATGPDAGAGVATSPTTSAPASPSEPAPTTAATTAPTSTAPAGSAPRILGIVSIDPSDTDGEHQEAVGRAIDGDPATFWFSMTYKSDDFAGFKDGVGLALALPRGTLVRTVTLQVNGTGGNVEIRATDAANPTAGRVLASGPLAPGTFTLDPATTTDSLVLWFTQLPTTADGTFRIELAEITLG